MSGKTLYDKLWDAHVVDTDGNGTSLLYIDRHLVHEVTSPQAFEGLRLAGRKPWRVGANLAVPDHNVPTTNRSRGVSDPTSRAQLEALLNKGWRLKATKLSEDFGYEEFLAKRGEGVLVPFALNERGQLRVATDSYLIEPKPGWTVVAFVPPEEELTRNAEVSK